MTARLAVLLPRLAVLTTIWLLATATFTFAAGGRELERRTQTPSPREAPKTLRVPDVRGRVYVFAKQLLQDAGLAWRVEGDVRGYAANIVSSQFPAPGVELADTGAPAVTLTLSRNPAYEQHGSPEDSSSRRETELVSARTGEPVARPKRTGVSRAAGTLTASPYREPDFAVAGSPRELADQLPLPERARLLGRRLAAQPVPTRELVRHWFYQHAWVVIGAGFGWRDGAEALRTLIAIDEDLQARWGIGAKSAAVARAALLEVEQRRAGR